MLDFETVKGIKLHGREVKKLMHGADVLWQSGGGGYADAFADNTWEQIVAACQADAVPETWVVGDMKELDLGAVGVIHMQIAGLNVDDRADGLGKAHISLLSKELYPTTLRMNPDLSPSSSPYTVGTGTIGGWEHSEMRANLKSTIKPLFPSVVRSAIVPVTKTQKAYNTSGSSQTQTTQDDIWLPSRSEIKGTSAIYVTLFPDNESRKKYRLGTGTAASWWLRDAGAKNNFNYVTSTGTSDSNKRAMTADYFVFGFCL